MIYLCSVYSHPDKRMMQARYEYVAKRTAGFMKDKHNIFSPINHCHPIAELYDMPRTWDFWKYQDLQYIDASEEVWVLKMHGWEESTGVQAEIAYATEQGKNVVYFEADDSPKLDMFKNA